MNYTYHEINHQIFILNWTTLRMFLFSPQEEPEVQLLGPGWRKLRAKYGPGSQAQTDVRCLKEQFAQKQLKSWGVLAFCVLSQELCLL